MIVDLLAHKIMDSLLAIIVDIDGAEVFVNGIALPFFDSARIHVVGAVIHGLHAVRMDLLQRFRREICPIFATAIFLAAFFI